MITLNLKKLSKGYYQTEADGITITVSNPFVCCGSGSNAWQLTIEDNTDVLLNNWFDKKSEAMRSGAEWVINNL